MRLYVFGNGNLSFADFVAHYATALDGALADRDCQILVGDFRGVDTLTMEHLKHGASRARCATSNDAQPPARCR